MATRQYIGARYVPKFYDFNGSPNWRAGVEYDGLTIVTRNGNSYTSKKPVPSNIGEPENNPDYWVATGTYNEQVETYRQITNEVSDRLDRFMSDGAIGTENLADNSVTTNKLSEEVQVDIFKGYGTPQMYGAKADGVTDDTQSFVDAIANHDVVYVPSGTYILSDTITLGEGKKLIGSNNRRSILRFGNCDGIHLANYVDRSGNILENLFISTAASNEHVGITMNRTNYAVLTNVAIENFTYGIYGDLAVLNEFYNLYILRCNTGVFFTNGSYSNTLYSCVITACGVAIDGGVARLIAYNLDIEMSGVCDIQNITTVIVYNGNFERSGAASYSVYITQPGISYFFSYVTFHEYPTAIYGTTAGINITAQDCIFVGCETEMGNNSLSYYRLEYPTYRTSGGNTKTPNLTVDLNKGVIFDTVWSTTGYTIDTNAKLSAKSGAFESLMINGNTPLVAVQRGRISVDFGTITAHGSKNIRVTTPSATNPYTQIPIVSLSDKPAYQGLIIYATIPTQVGTGFDILVINTSSSDIALGTCNVNYIIL